MISRVAASCFWLHRYIERADALARLLSGNRDFVLEVGIAPADRWLPVIIVSGEEKRFTELFGAKASNDGDVVQEYMTWDERNPVSLNNSIRWARENARTIREVISADMWETLNGTWNWLCRGQGRRTYGQDRSAFYQRIRQRCSEFQGVCHNTMMHEQPFDFMRLGMLLERGMQTARTLDVKHHMLGPTGRRGESPEEAAHWSALLKSCSADDLFYKHSRGAPNGPAVAAFLLKEPLLPRSVLHCLTRAWNFLRRIRAAGPPHVGQRSAAVLQTLVKSLESRSVEEILERGVHEELTRLIDTTSELCGALDAEYFNPPPKSIAPRAESTTS